MYSIVSVDLDQLARSSQLIRAHAVFLYVCKLMLITGICTLTSLIDKNWEDMKISIVVWVNP